MVGKLTQNEMEAKTGLCPNEQGQKTRRLFRRHDQASSCGQDLLPEITGCNVIAAHICRGSRGTEAATSQRPGHTRPGPLTGRFQLLA